MVDCANCIEKCQQAAAANEIAKGRMFAEREFINLINKIENGTLVEVVRCEDCKWRNKSSWGCTHPGHGFAISTPDFYCADGERKGGDE